MLLKKLSLIVFVLIFFFNCASRPEDNLIGKWQELEKTGTLEFFKDGTVSLEHKGNTDAGSFKVLEDNNIRFDLSKSGTDVFTYSISDDILTLSSLNGRTSKYKKIT